MRSSAISIPNGSAFPGAFFDIQKLNWVNQKKIIESIPEDKLWDRLSRWNFNEAFMRKLDAARPYADQDIRRLHAALRFLLHQRSENHSRTALPKEYAS